MGIAVFTLLLQVLTPVDTTREVVVIVNEALPESVELGRYYASRRGIPLTQILYLKTGIGEVISWPDYREQIEKPLRQFLESRKDVRYIVPIYGVPVKTKEENKANDKKEGGPVTRYVESRDYCCIDREIELLHKEHLLEGWIRSDTFKRNRPITAKDGVYIVCRLDGPSAESVRAMIDNAIYGETYGIEGTSFLDTRGLSEGSYASIDKEMKNIAQVYEKYGIPFRHDVKGAVIPLGTHPDQAHYWGWYTSHVKAKKGFRFNRGAVGAHMHSYSAGRLRKTDKNWAGPLVYHGITATCGTVYEPLASGFPFGTIFLDRFFQGYNFGQSMQMANMFTSWMAVFVGDPLYAPYAKGRAEVQARNRELVREGPKLLEKALNEGRLKEAEKSATQMKALAEFPVQGDYMGFLIREVRARTLSSKPASGTVGELWKLIGRAQKEDALAHARRGLLLSPNNFECNRIAGEELLQKKKAKDALEHLQRAVAVDPQSARVRHSLGRTFRSLKKHDEALLSLEEAHRLGGGADVLLDIGELLFSKKQYDEVVKRLEPVMEGRPSALILVGRALLAQKKPDSAVKVLEKAVKLPSATADAWSLLSKAYRAAGNPAESKKVSAVAKSFSLRKRFDARGSRRDSIRKRVMETFGKNPAKLLAPLKEEGPRGLPVLLLANKSGWTMEVFIDGSLVRSETLRSSARPRATVVPLYPGMSRMVVVARKGKEEKLFAGEVLFELDRVYSYGFESLTKLYPLKK